MNNDSFGKRFVKSETVPLIIAIIIDCVIIPTCLYFALRADKFEGRWICNYIESGGIKMPAEFLGEFELVFDGHGTVKVVEGKNAHDEVYEYSGDDLTMTRSEDNDEYTVKYERCLEYDLDDDKLEIKILKGKNPRTLFLTKKKSS